MSSRLKALMLATAWKASLLTVVAAVVCLLAVTTTAQNTRPSVPLDLSADKDSPETQRSSSPLEEEMRAKRAIKFAENEHKENLERARELSDIASRLESSFQKKRSFDREDEKRLDRLAKLARQLRSNAGGSSSEVKLEKIPPTLEQAVNRVIEVSESLSALVQKTPRRVVSATVIDEANVLLELIEIVRQFTR